MNRALLAVSLAAATLVPAQDDQPGRGVARVSLLNGDVTVKRGDSGDMVAAAINAPLLVQDQLQTGAGARAELQYDFANFLRLGADTDLRLRELEYRKYMVELGRGVITWHVGKESASDIDINTPSISVRPIRPGDYRVSVREDGTTEITVRRGEAEIHSPKGVQRLREGSTMMVRGTPGDPEFQLTAEIAEDEWDRWNVRRDRDLERSASRKYVANDVLGTEELDQYGSWVDSEPYGRVWSPRVAAGWAPYSNGRWSWLDYYGWSWVSYDPFGWAPFHHGRWFWNANRWCWWPGPAVGRTWWRPALVAWFGYGGVGVGVGYNNWGWVPLAPFEPFHPWYGSRFYRGGWGGPTVVNNIRIVNNYNIVNNYRNARINGAVSGVDATRFGRGHSSGYDRVGEANLRNANLMQGQLPASPQRESLAFNNREVRGGGAGIRGGGSEGQFYSRRQATAVDRVSFDDQRRGMEQATHAFAGSNGGMRGAGGGAGSNEGAGLRGGSSAARAESQQQNGGGWRRFGEPAYTGNGGAGIRGGGEAVRGVAPSSTRGGGSGDAASGWRNFGETGGVRGGGDAGRGGAVYGVESERSNTRSNDSGWRRFGGGSDNGAGVRGGGTGNPADGASSVDSYRGGTRGSSSGSTVYGGESLRVNPPAVYDRGSSRSSSGGYRGDGSSSGASVYSAPPTGSGGYRGGSSGGSDMVNPGGSGMRGSGGYSGGDSGFSRGSGMRGSGGYSGGDSGSSRSNGGSGMRGSGGFSSGGDSGSSRGNSGGFSSGGGMRGGSSGGSGGFSSGGGGSMRGGSAGPSGGGMRGGGGGGASGGFSGGGGGSRGSGGGGGGRGGSRGN